MLVGHLRAHADLRPRRRLLRAARAHRDRALPDRGRRPSSCPWRRRSPSSEARELSEPEQPRRPARAARAAGGRRGARGQADGGRAADRDRRGSRGRAPARRSVRPGMKVTQLPDVPPGSGPREVAIGTFDGVHLGHREVIRGADTVLTFDPHPLAVIHPEATPKLIASRAVKRDLIAVAGRRRDGRDPVRPGLLRADRRGVRGRGPDRPAGGDPGLGRRELPLRQGGAGHRGLPALARRVRDARRAARRGGRGDGVVEPHPRADRRRRRQGGGRVPGRAVPVRGRGRDRRPARAHARDADRQPRPRRRVRLPGPRGLRGLRPRATRRPSTSACAPPSTRAAGCWWRRT